MTRRDAWPRVAILQERVEYSANPLISNDVATLYAIVSHFLAGRILRLKYSLGVREFGRDGIVGKQDKLRNQILSGASDENISFLDLRNLLKRLGFEERIRGDHHILTRDGVNEIINVQPKGSKAKPYQVRQVRALIVKYDLGDPDVD